MAYETSSLCFRKLHYSSLTWAVRLWFTSYQLPTSPSIIGFPERERCAPNESQLVSSSVQASFQRSNSHDKVRKIVAEEGRTARNLIAWSVPLENKEEEGWLPHTNQAVHVFSSVLADCSHTLQRFVCQAAATLSDKGKLQSTCISRIKPSGWYINVMRTGSNNLYAAVFMEYISF